MSLEARLDFQAGMLGRYRSVRDQAAEYLRQWQAWQCSAEVALAEIQRLLSYVADEGPKKKRDKKAEP